MEKQDKTLLPLGSKAPQFDLEASDEGRVSLGDLRGKFSVIVFYPKSNTPG